MIKLSRKEYEYNPLTSSVAVEFVANGTAPVSAVFYNGTTPLSSVDVVELQDGVMVANLQTTDTFPDKIEIDGEPSAITVSSGIDEYISHLPWSEETAISMELDSLSSAVAVIGNDYTGSPVKYAVCNAYGSSVSSEGASAACDGSVVSSATVFHRLCHRYVLHGSVRNDGSRILALLDGAVNGLEIRTPASCPGIGSEFQSGGHYVEYSSAGNCWQVKNWSDASSAAYVKTIDDDFSIRYIKSSAKASVSACLVEENGSPVSYLPGDHVIATAVVSSGSSAELLSPDGVAVMSVALGTGLPDRFDSPILDRSYQDPLAGPAVVGGPEGLSAQEMKNVFAPGEDLLDSPDVVIVRMSNGLRSLPRIIAKAPFVFSDSPIQMGAGFSMKCYCKDAESDAKIRLDSDSLRQVTGISAAWVQARSDTPAEEHNIKPEEQPEASPEDTPYYDDQEGTYNTISIPVDNMTAMLPFGSELGDAFKERIEVGSDLNNDELPISVDGTYVLLDASKTGYDKVYHFKTYQGSHPDTYITSVLIGGVNYWCIATAPAVDSSSSEIIIRAREGGSDYANNIPEAFSKYYIGNNLYDAADGSIEKKAPNSQHQRSRIIYARLVDNALNCTEWFQVKMTIWQIIPSIPSFALYGPDGSKGYAGVRRLSSGQMIPCGYVNAKVTAVSDLPMSYHISAKPELMPRESTAEKEILSGVSEEVGLRLKIGEYGTILSSDVYRVPMTVTVTDDAGNISTKTASIAMIPCIFRTEHQRLVPESADYSHTFRDNSNHTISPTTTIEGSYTRAWNEVWWPATHAPALLDDGTIDPAAALEAAKNGYDDSLSLTDEGDSLRVDDQGRYVQNIQKWDREKKYDNFVNTRTSGGSYLECWLIDSGGDPDFQLEFEVFDFDKHAATIPGNYSAPSASDMLAIYDASDADAVRDDGSVNSSKLSLLCVIKGSCFDSSATQKFTLERNSLVGTLIENGNGFTTPILNGIRRVCLVPFTDNGDTASGFKLKAGPRTSVKYSNYDVSERTGEVWFHLAPQSADGDWNGLNSAKASYKYYASYTDIDPQTGTVSFDVRPTHPLIGTFTAMPYLSTKTINDQNSRFATSYFSIGNPPDPIRTYALSNDDLVDYLTPTFSVECERDSIGGQQSYDPSTSQTGSSGRISSGFSLSKDTGILTFNKAVDPPVGRILSEYYHHTFYRLSSDGYGDLYFYGVGVLVPAKPTENHIDWAYVDVKLVNEGTNTLNQGTLQFLSRGYITGGSIVDTVLDVNRPWDVQEGSVAETVNRAGAKSSQSYAFLNTDKDCIAERKNAFNARGVQTCVFGTLAPKQTVYVRIFWTIQNDADGTTWISCTKGRKTFSAEISGTYFLN